jgi:hypothetical protein
MFIHRIKRKIIRTVFNEQWSLLVCDPEGHILTHIAPPADRFWADPFPVEYNGRTFIFIEQQIGSENGTIGFIELYNDLSHSNFIPILQKSYHLSFPNVFSVRKDNCDIWYMIPESNENRSIDLYRAVDFPCKWVFDLTLMEDLLAVDTTVIYYESKWWLFTSISVERKSVNRNLSLFSSDTFPSNTWVSHPQNPICTSLNNSRMAGLVFFDQKDNCLYRPAQNCLKDYGKEININKIIELNSHCYKEETIKTIFPETKLHAVCTHTVNYSPNYILRDIKTRKFCFKNEQKDIR